MTSATLSPKPPLSTRPSQPISDGEAPRLLSPRDRLPRRRKPNSTAVGVQTSNDIHGSLASGLAVDPNSGVGVAASEPNSDVAAIVVVSPHRRLRQSSEPNVTGAEAMTPLPPSRSVPFASGHTINTIRELHRQRQDLLRTEGDLTRRLRALCRRSVGYSPFEPAKERTRKMALANAMYIQIQRPGGHVLVVTQAENAAEDAEFIFEDDEGQARLDIQRATADAVLTPSGEGGGQRDGDTQNYAAAPFAAPCLVSAQTMIRRERMVVERMMVKQAKTLPIYTFFVEPLNGFGPLGLSQIIGEAGDPSLYANPAKLWKRMGLGLVDGERQRKHVDATKAAAHGYSPIRRSTMYSIGVSLIKKESAFRTLYLERKEYETGKAEAQGLTVMAANKIPKGKTDQHMSLMHVHRRAQRYMEKRLLRDLWRAWRVAMT